VLFRSTTFLSTTTKYFDLLEAGVRTQVNESPNSRRTRFASKNLAWADSWVAMMSLAMLHFNNPYMCFTDLVQKFGFDLPEAYYQSLDELFVRSIKTRHTTPRTNSEHLRREGSKLRSEGCSFQPTFPCRHREASDGRT
jgi:hypothetical protein